MKTLSAQLRNRIKAEEWASIMEDFQQEGKRKHAFLDSNLFLDKRRQRWIEKAGVFFLALFVSAVAIIANYIIFIRMLHANF